MFYLPSLHQALRPFDKLRAGRLRGASGQAAEWCFYHFGAQFFAPSAKNRVPSFSYEAGGTLAYIAADVLSV
jgi:hypothetical protein